MNPFSILTSKIFAGLSAALLLVCVGLLLRGNFYENLAEKRQHAITALKAAGEAAKAKQIALNIAAENKSAQIARKADADKQTALRTLADRYRDANRVPASCRPVRTSAPAKDSPPGGGDGPGETAELYVAISPNDYEILVENSLRLERVHQWGNDLITEKLAIPGVEF